MHLGRTTLIRHTDERCEFAVDSSHLPLLITTWFGSPSLELVETYAKWFDEFIERSRRQDRRFVILDDATRAERPAPAVRGRMSKIECPRDVVVDRVIVVQTRPIRGAITALSWIIGNPIKTNDTLEGGVRECLELLDAAKVSRPREFEFEPAQPSAR